MMSACLPAGRPWGVVPVLVTAPSVGACLPRGPLLPPSHLPRDGLPLCPRALQCLLLPRASPLPPSPLDLCRCACAPAPWPPSAPMADRPLLAIAGAWTALHKELGDGDVALRLGSFSHGCSLIWPLFSSLGYTFKSRRRTTWPKRVHDLRGATKEYDTLPAMVDHDIRNDTVRNGGSHTRNLLRVLRGVDMVRVLFEHILVTEGNSLKEPASKAYDQVFAAHHSWAIRKAVSAGMFMLPTKTQFLKKLHEEEDSARAHIQDFVKSSTPVVEYVNNMYINKELGTDW